LPERARRKFIDAATFEVTATILPARHRSTRERMAGMSSRTGTKHRRESFN